MLPLSNCQHRAKKPKHRIHHTIKEIVALFILIGAAVILIKPTLDKAHNEAQISSAIYTCSKIDLAYTYLGKPEKTTWEEIHAVLKENGKELAISEYFTKSPNTIHLPSAENPRTSIELNGDTITAYTPVPVPYTPKASTISDILQLQWWIISSGP